MFRELALQNRLLLTEIFYSIFSHLYIEFIKLLWHIVWWMLSILSFVIAHGHLNRAKKVFNFNDFLCHFPWCSFVEELKQIIFDWCWYYVLTTMISLFQLINSVIISVFFWNFGTELSNKKHLWYVWMFAFNAALNMQVLKFSGILKCL